MTTLDERCLMQGWRGQQDQTASFPLPSALGSQPDLPSPLREGISLCSAELSTAASNTSVHPLKPNKNLSLNFKMKKISRPLQGEFLPREKGNDAANPFPFHLSTAAAPSPPALQPGDTGMIQRLSRHCWPFQKHLFICLFVYEAPPAFANHILKEKRKSPYLQSPFPIGMMLQRSFPSMGGQGDSPEGQERIRGTGTPPAQTITTETPG